MAMFHSLPSIHVKHQKNTAELESVIMPVPAEVTISMSQHIGAPCKPVVKVGDTVKVGQLIGEKLRDSLNAIPWPDIQDKAVQWATNLATMLNGIVETPGLWEAIGHTLAPNRKPLSSPPMASRPSMRPSLRPPSARSWRMFWWRCAPAV